MIRKYLSEVVIERDADGGYIADCRALPDCKARGESYKEAFDKVVRVIEERLTRKGSIDI